MQKDPFMGAGGGGFSLQRFKEGSSCFGYYVHVIC